MLSPIPLATLPMPKPAKVIVKPQGCDLAQGNRFTNHIARRTTLHEVRAFHEQQEEARKEAYAAGWVLAKEAA